MGTKHSYYPEVLELLIQRYIDEFGLSGLDRSKGWSTFNQYAALTVLKDHYEEAVPMFEYMKVKRKLLRKRDEKNASKTGRTQANER
jgi:hypothetical protein